MAAQIGVSGKRPSLIPWLFPLGLGLVIAVNMGLLWFAVGTYPGIVTSHAYEEGRKYNRVLELDTAQTELGWQVDIAYLSESANTIEVRCRDRDGTPIEGLTTWVTASRPVGDAILVELSLSPKAPGIYRGALLLPHRGIWDVRVTAVNASFAYQRTARIRAP